MISNIWAIQRIFDIRLFDLSNGQCLGFLNDLKQTNFSQEGTIVYADGSAGNPHIIGFDHSKRAKITCQNATFDMLTLGTQVGATPVTGTNTNVVITDILKVTSNTATTSYTALGANGNQIGYAYIKNSDGSLGNVFAQAATPTVDKFSYNSGTKLITFNGGAITDNTEIVVFYNATSGSSTVTISSYADLFAKNVKMVAEGLVRNTATGVDYGAEIIFYKSKMSNNFNFDLAADGNPAIQNFELEALKQSGSTKLWDMIIFDESELV
jgi:hypothetical protein